MGYVKKVHTTARGNDCSTVQNWIIRRIEYNAFGQMTLVKRGNGTRTEYTYDKKQRLLKLTTTKQSGQVEEVYQDVQYRFNVNNSIRSVENNPLMKTPMGNLEANHTTRYDYQYDGLNRLILAEGSYSGTASKDFKRGYKYARNGNLLKKRFYTPGTNKKYEVWNYHYGQNNHAVTQISRKNGQAKFALTYDENGNTHISEDLGKAQTKQNFFTSENRIRQVYNPDGDTEFTRKVGEYLYDEQGFRTRKVSRRLVNTSTGEQFSEIELLYPNMYFTVEVQRNETGQERPNSYQVVNHIYIEGLRIAAIAPNEGPDRVRYFLSDQVDSVKLVTDEKGKVVSRFEYYPYGESFVEENYQEEEAIAPKFGSQELDKESGYYYFNARHYNPEIARFVSADPVIDGVEDTQGWNRYSYVKGNPVVYKDPTGNDAWSETTYSPEGGNGAGTFTDEHGNTYPVEIAATAIGEKVEDGLQGAKDSKGSSLGGQILDAALDLIPIANVVRGVTEAITGENVVTGEKLSVGERILGALPYGRLAKKIFKGGKATGKVLGVAGKGNKGVGRRKRNKLEPDPNADGHHTTFKRGNDGKIYKYETYEKTKKGNFNPRKRYDGGKPDGTPGKPHRNKKTEEEIHTPHVQGKKIPGGVRPARENEVPK